MLFFVDITPSVFFWITGYFGGFVIICIFIWAFIKLIKKTNEVALAQIGRGFFRPSERVRTRTPDSAKDSPTCSFLTSTERFESKRTSNPHEVKYEAKNVHSFHPGNGIHFVKGDTMISFVKERNGNSPFSVRKQIITQKSSSDAKVAASRLFVGPTDL